MAWSKKAPGDATGEKKSRGRALMRARQRFPSLLKIKVILPFRGLFHVLVRIFPQKSFTSWKVSSRVNSDWTARAYETG
jgi:hypothetical protein